MIREGSPQGAENELIVLDSSLLSSYPEMRDLSGILKTSNVIRDAAAVSAVYQNGAAVDVYIRDVKGGVPTGHIEDHLQMVETGLNELEALQEPKYQRFIQHEREKLMQRKKEAQLAIGERRRRENGIYE